MKDETILLLAGGAAIAGYFMLKQGEKAVSDIAGIPASIGSGFVQAGSDAVNTIEKTLENAGTTAYQTVDDTLKGAAAATMNTIQAIGNIPAALTPPMPQYIQNAVTKAKEDKGLFTTTNKPYYGSTNFPAIANIMNTQKFGYIAPINFDQPLPISTILQRSPAVYTGGSYITPKPATITPVKTYENSGVPYASSTYNSYTGQSTPLVFTPGTTFQVVKSPAPTKSVATPAVTKVAPVATKPTNYIIVNGKFVKS